MSDTQLMSRLRNGPYFAIGDQVKFRDDCLLIIAKTEIVGLGAACDGLAATVVGTEDIGGIRRVDLVFSSGQILKRIHASELQLVDG